MKPNSQLTVELASTPALGPLPHGVRIRRFEAPDAPEVHALLAEGSPRALDGLETWVRTLLTDPDFDEGVCLLADTDAGELVGAVLARRPGLVTDVVVAAAWRRRGAGRALLGRVLELFRRRGRVRARFEGTEELDEGASKFFASLGFEPADSR